jgi:SAM-dependent methyltransferase/general stress protein 26
METDPFAGKAEWFDEGYRTTAHGQLRLRLVMDRLVPKLPSPPARVLDAGGGTGAFAVPLAGLGYDVTILDSSSEWLEVAQRSAREAGLTITTIQGRVEDRVPNGPFDAVLCHTVLIYADEPLRVLRSLRSVARPGALLSSLEKNRDALPVRPARQGDFEEALRVMDDPVASGRLGIPNRALTHGELRSLMVRAGWIPTSWAGIRVYSDGVLEQLEPGSFEALHELDTRASTREPHRRFGRLLHVLGSAWEPASLEALRERSVRAAARGTVDSWPPQQALRGSALEEFVDRKRYAMLSTTRRDGRPHAAVVAYCVLDGRFWLPAVACAQRVRNVESEPAASLLIVEGEEDEHVAVSIEGLAAVHTDNEARRILDDRLREAWRARYGSGLEWARAIVELVPTRVLSHDARPPAGA